MEVCDRAFSVMEAPFQRDTVRELCDAARISTDHSPIRPTLGVQGDGVMTIGNRFVTITYKPGKRTGCPIPVAKSGFFALDTGLGTACYCR